MCTYTIYTVYTYALYSVHIYNMKCTHLQYIVYTYTIYSVHILYIYELKIDIDIVLLKIYTNLLITIWNSISRLAVSYFFVVPN